MDNILIAEDNPVLQKILRAGLKKYHHQFDIFFAKDGQEAIDYLKKESVHLLVTDLQMPNVDGLSLLAYMNENHPEVPCIVMTAHGTPQLREKLQQDVLSFIEKPFEIDDLVQVILPALKREVAHGALFGISIVSFLQMIEIEQKTCLLEVETSEGKGYFYFEDGVLFDAVRGELKGLDAAVQLIPMEKAKIRLKHVEKSGKKIMRRITQDLMTVIMEAMRIKDEADNDTDTIELQNIAENLTVDLPKTEGSDSVEIEKAISESKKENKPPREINGIEIFSKDSAPYNHFPAAGGFDSSKKQPFFTLKECMAELKQIHGFRASAIITDSGDILEGECTDPDLDFDYLSAFFNDTFQSVNRACIKTGFESNQEMSIVTSKGTIIMRRSEDALKTPFHVFALLDPGGNQALMKIEMKRMIPRIAAELE